MSGRAYKDISGAHGSVAIDVSGGNQTLASGCRALYVGVTGNIKITMPDGSTPTFSNVPVGIFPVQATTVFQTGTTATSVIALY